MRSKINASSNPSTSPAIGVSEKTTSFITFRPVRAILTTNNKCSAICRRFWRWDFLIRLQHACLTEEGARGGINVIFEVKELPIIRDLQFEGLEERAESDVLKAFRERRVGISKESIYDPVKARNAIRVLKELLAARGHPNATVEERREEVSATSTRLLS